MNTYYIARHGETENNVSKRLSGWIDTPLTISGLEPTKSVIAKLDGLHIDRMYSSDLGRAFITAYVIARGIGYSGDIDRLPGIREVSYGDAANMFSVDAYAKYPGLDSDTHFVPPNGESLDQMQQRVFATIDKLNGKLDESTILLVCHSGVMAALKASHVGQDFGAHNISEAYAHDFVGKFTFQNGTVTSFEPYGG